MDRNVVFAKVGPNPTDDLKELSLLANERSELFHEVSKAE
jgi:hypothetical protein